MAALSHAFPNIPSSCCHCRISNLKEDHKVCVWGFSREISDNEIGVSRVYWKTDNNNLTGRWTVNAVDTHIVETAPPRTTVEIPITCYQLIGVPDQVEKMRLLNQ
ncbi:hypothetical protein CerSpe_161840 [Prunus speciosa]